MKTYFLLLVNLCLSLNLFSQNLVLNPGFDNYISCPAFGQFNNTFISFWDKPTIGSSDYFNFNCPAIQPVQQLPRSGEGYAGIYCYNYGTEYREYISGTFLSPLQFGVKYNVEFYVSLNDGYIQAIKEVGAYISNSIPGPFTNALHINVVPQIENTILFLTDTVNWTKISGQFTAAGGEQYITIGNFHDDLTTSISQPGTIGSFGAYYFIDDVSVIPDSTTSLSESQVFELPNIYFDLDKKLTVDFNKNCSWKFPVNIYCYNKAGGLVFKNIISSQKNKFAWPEKSNENYIFYLEDNIGRRGYKKIFYAAE